MKDKGLTNNAMFMNLVVFSINNYYIKLIDHFVTYKLYIFEINLSTIQIVTKQLYMKDYGPKSNILYRHNIHVLFLCLKYK